MAKDVVLEICDYDWNRLYVTPNVVEAHVTRELGTIGEGEVTIPAQDPAISYLPDPNTPKSNEGRWRLYEDGELTFAGVVDQTTRRINADNTYTFGGKHRGILFGQTNMGRRNFTGWRLPLLFEELLRDNIAKAPIASIEEVTSERDERPAINIITGDIIKRQYWASDNKTDAVHYVVIDLGDNYDIVGVRVIPPWWDNNWYNFRVTTGDDGVSFTDQGGYEQNFPLSDKGKLIEFTDNCRYVKVRITDSGDGYGRLAGVLVYRALGEVGSDTDYVVPWIENDDSENITYFGDTERRTTNGAFNGDGVIGHSFTTRLNSGGRADHRFRGTANSVYFTQGRGTGSAGGARADIYLDNVFQENVHIPTGTFQYEGFTVENLSNGQHYLSVRQTSGTPQIDYFTGLYETAWRKVRDDSPEIGFFRGWQVKTGSHFTDYSHKRSAGRDAYWLYDNFYGDHVKVIGTKGHNYGIQEFKIDGVLEDTYDQYNATPLYKRTMFNWSGSYGNHDLLGKHYGGKNSLSDGYHIDVDEIRGNFQHIIYMRSYWETNLRMLTRLSEITQTYLRFNDDGTVDLLSKVGEWSETIVREGENEGGSIIEAEIEDDYSETCSAVLALVSQSDGPPIKAFVIDRKAIDRMGLKIRKIDMADANDAYLLTRQAWSELQEHAYPTRRYNVQFDHEQIGGDIEPGETTTLYSPSTGLNEEFRVGRITTDFDSEEATEVPNEQ